MKQVILLAVVGLVVGLGGGTGIAVMTAPRVAVDSTRADSSHAAMDSTVEVVANHDTTSPDSAGHDEPPADSGAAVAGRAPAATNDAPAVADSTSPAPAVDTHPSAAGEVQDAAADSATAVQLKRISRTFASMSPRDAAKVLELMEDADVTAILGSLNEKQGAAILAAFPAARAAAISRQRLSAARKRTP